MATYQGAKNLMMIKWPQKIEEKIIICWKLLETHVPLLLLQLKSPT